jgi:hypothetical protein
MTNLQLEPEIEERGWDLRDDLPEGWSRYVFFDEEFPTSRPVGRAVARDDNAIVDCAERVATYLCINRMQVMKLIPLGIAQGGEEPEDDDADPEFFDHVGVTYPTLRDDGEEISEDLLLGLLRVLDFKLKAAGLPSIMDEWKEWPAANGSYYVGTSDTVNKIYKLLCEEATPLGCGIYVHFPAAAFLNVCTPEEWETMKEVYGRDD